MLVVEILSHATRWRKEQQKRAFYQRIGVPEYWMVDPSANRIGIHRPNDEGRLMLSADLGAAAGDTLTTPLLPGFSLALADYFR